MCERLFGLYVRQGLDVQQDNGERVAGYLDYLYNTPVLITHRGLESDEDDHQTNDMTALWKKLGFSVERSIPDGLIRFSLVDQFINPNSEFIAKRVVLMS